MKTIVIGGGVTKDAVTRTTGQGEKVTSFSVAVSEGFGDKKRTLYFDCNLWGARGEKLAGYITKGSKISVAGELSTREHDGKTYLTVRADQVTLMSGKPEGQKSDGYGAGGRPSARSDMDDEIPFAPEVR